MPSSSSEPSASSSPKPQSILPLRLMSWRLLSSCWIFGCTVKPAGLLSNASPIACTTSVETPVVSSSPETTSVVARRLGGADDRDRAGLRGVRLGEGPLEAVLEVAVRLLVLLLGDVATSDERLGVELADRALRLDEVVHERLRHRGVVALVVAAAAVADEVDDDVALELLAVAERELGDPHDGLGVVAVHVEDRGLDGLRDIRRVDRRARVARHGGEADLVVDVRRGSCRRCGSRAAATSASSRRRCPGRPSPRRRARGSAASRRCRWACGPAWRARCPRARRRPPRGATGSRRARRGSGGRRRP